MGVGHLRSWRSGYRKSYGPKRLGTEQSPVNSAGNRRANALAGRLRTSSAASDRLSSLAMSAFSELGLAPDLLQAVHDVGYESPSPIQEQAIPPLLEGLDVIGQ